MSLVGFAGNMLITSKFACVRPRGGRQWRALSPGGELRFNSIANSVWAYLGAANEAAERSCIEIEPSDAAFRSSCVCIRVESLPLNMDGN